MEPMEDMSKLKLSNMFIDIGVKNKKEAESLINIGDVCVYLRIIMKMKILFY